MRLSPSLTRTAHSYAHADIRDTMRWLTTRSQSFATSGALCVMRWTIVLSILLATGSHESGVAESAPPDAPPHVLPHEGIRALACMGADVSSSTDDNETGAISVALTPEAYSAAAIEIVCASGVPVTLILHPGVELDDDTCRRLASSRNLVGLSLPDSGISARGFAVFAGALQLRSLDLSDRDLTTTNAASLRCLDVLDNLVIDRTTLTEAHWRAIAKAPRLARLSCQGVALTADAWNAIRSVPRLRTLALGGERLAQSDFNELGGLESLENLTIRDARLSYEQLLPLANLQRLRTLDLNGTLADEYCLRAIGKMSGLQELDLGGTSLRGQHAASLGQVPHLAKLAMSDSRLDDEGLRIIATLHGLRSLDVERCAAISDDGVRALGALSDLQELRVSNRSLTDRGIAVVSQLPDLRVVAAGGSTFSAAGLDSLRECKQLRELCLRYSRQDREPQFVAAVMQRVEGIESLEKLEVSGLRQTADSLATLHRLPRLEALTLCFSDLDDEAVDALSSLKSLRSLDLRFNERLTDDAVDSLLRCDHLADIWVTSGELSSDGVTRLGKRFVVHRPTGTLTIRVNPITRPVTP
jgi:Leucine-rich repeat (LRR) protein